MSTVEHKVEMHRLVTTRRAEGKPVWDRTIRIGHAWKNPDMTFEQRRDEIVACIRSTSWYRSAAAPEADHELPRVVENLASADDAEEWDEWWDEFYDLADYDRVWIDTSAPSHR